MLPINDSTNTNETKCIEINALYRLLVDNDSIKNSDTQWIDFYDDLAGSNLAAFVDVENYFSDGNPSSALTINSSLTGTNTVEYNYISFYRLYGAYMQDNFSQTDSTLLYELASLCPGLNGPAVYQARALYNQIYWQADDYFDDCVEGGGERRFTVLPTTTSINMVSNTWNVDMFPNPAFNTLTLVSKTVTEKLHIRIADVNGKIVMENNLVTSNFIVNFNLDVIPGIYTVFIKNPGGEISFKKLVVAK